MERLEDRHEVIAAGALGVGRVGEQESDAIGQSLGSGVGLRALDRPRVDVDAIHGRPREVAGDRDRRPACAAGDVGDPARASAQPCRDVRQRIDPVADETGELGPIDAFLGFDDIRAVVRPIDTGARPICSEEVGHPLRGPDDEPGERRQVRRARLIDEDLGVTTRTVDTHIVHLRQKLEPNPEEPRFILTVHGSGYKFVG